MSYHVAHKVVLGILGISCVLYSCSKIREYTMKIHLQVRLDIMLIKCYSEWQISGLIATDIEVIF